MFWDDYRKDTQHNNASAHDDVFDPTKAAIAPLADYRLISVVGPDARKFLQGQCTCDFQNMGDNTFLTGAHCSPKGRMISSFVAAPQGTNTIALRLHESIAEIALSALQKYAVFSKVELTLLDEYVGFALLNTDNLSAFNTSLKIINPGQTSYQSQTLILQHSSDNMEIWSTKESALAHLNAFASVDIQNNSNSWRLKNIQSGIGEVQLPLTEKLLPQEMNFQEIGAVSFKKGCYTGQEIIARLHYKGQLKKHMARGCIKSEQKIETNQLIYTENTNEKPKGTVLNVAHSGENTYEFLALCDDKIIDDNSCYIENNATTKIQWLTLPYAIN
ncbi:MAG: folate-binding protein [Agarilytica sp.]